MPRCDNSVLVFGNCHPGMVGGSVNCWWGGARVDRPKWTGVPWTPIHVFRRSPSMRVGGERGQDTGSVTRRVRGDALAQRACRNCWLLMTPSLSSPIALAVENLPSERTNGSGPPPPRRGGRRRSGVRQPQLGPRLRSRSRPPRVSPPPRAGGGATGRSRARPRRAETACGPGPGTPAGKGPVRGKGVGGCDVIGPSSPSRRRPAAATRRRQGR